jgi:hypothetical protein
MDILTNCFVKKDDSVTRQIAGETLIVPVRSHGGDVNSIFTMNELGAKIWKLIDGQTSVSKIVAAVLSEYDVPLEQATADIIDFLKSLEAEGLIGTGGV